MRAGKIVLGYFKKYWPRYFLGLILVFVSTYLATVIPLKLGEAIDALGSPQYTSYEVKRIALTLAVIAVLSFAARFVWRYLIIGFCRYVEFFLREKVFSHLLSLSSDFYTANDTGDIITRTISDVQAVRMMLGFGIVSIINTIVTVTMSVINMSASMNIYFTLMALVPVPFMVFVITRVRKLVKDRYKNVREAVSAISSKVQENITGIRVIKAFVQEEEESKVFDALSENKLKTEIEFARAHSALSPAVSLSVGIVFSAFLVAGGSMVAKGSASLGDFVAFNTYILLIMQPLGNIGRIVERWQRGITSMSRLDDILLSAPAVDDSKADFNIKSIESGQLAVKNLSFSIGEKSILKDVTFNLPDKGTIALMGPIGSGKSKLLEVIIRLWPCDDGVVFLDDKDINQIPLSVLRNNCSIVHQDTFLFSDTIFENIRMFDENINIEQVIEAARLADVHDNISEFPEGYETVVGERGMTLSGGQKQRVALARALIRKPKLLLLDDCLSAVDSQTEKRIIRNLKEATGDCSVIIVTHRVAAAALADSIVILSQDGEIAEIGAHEELDALGGYYSTLIKTAQSDEETPVRGCSDE
ncbi:MAG: ABC transporter ATP-binding protein [Acutalibacteraceae bacterium]